MKKRTNKKYEKGTVGYAVLACLEANGFDTVNTSAYPGIRFFDGYEGRLFVRINVYGDHASVSFGGTGVNKDRTMEYYLDDMKKFEARIKRVLKAANEKANYVHAKNQRNDNTFNVTNAKLIANGITDARQSDYGSDAIFIVNGYQLQCGGNLLISVNVGGNRIKLDVSQAVSLMESLPFNPEPEEE